MGSFLLLGIIWMIPFVDPIFIFIFIWNKADRGPLH
jgi:hypothetical protein